MIKKLLSLLWNGAEPRQYFIEVGVYFLKKGVGYEVGQIIREKKINHIKGKSLKVWVVKDITYSLRHNKVDSVLETQLINENNKYRLD
ncbi:hypothetical protein BN863_28670 [Formosa agariphila KMM 3901]|uniref:Uncharacterized protein n=1 Tax=Formosa agariphila (strain DSM 15362 / KCTC 12365 / LMG 23005 / KMM 3901 / M-2Alg 35-1) TaxID=1347342 RepID=T2KRE3_FORAG|nr:hypothetical protein [Formosa agariphila]CDF80579.1 hypothetical protein BN863_28670 [Formosa agariphila KMM 3901]